jgi:hypothetical protein
MTTGEEIRQAIRHIISQYLVTTKLREPKICTVLNVYANPNDAMVCDCQPTDKTAVIKNVRLIANYANNKAGFVLAPKVNSMVEISFNADSDAFISMVSEVDFIYLNGNDYGGLVQVQPLVDKLNNLENAYNDLVDKFNHHTHILTLSSGTGTAAQTVSQETTTLATTQKTDLENTTVLHGTGNLS